MESESQKNAFLSYEADAWFERNKSVLLNYKKEKDRVVTLISDYNLEIGNVLEVGCSAGYRLNAIKSVFETSKVFGIEPSKSAIAYGKANFTDVDFTNGTADDLNVYADNSMDIVIIGFVFYVIDRDIIFKVISEIDRVLKNGGILIIVDFFSETSLKNVYHHIQGFSAFSFKQNYEEIFTSSKLYYLLDKSTWNHTDKVMDATGNYSDKYSISLLKKDINASYK